MQSVNITELRANLLDYLKKAHAGETIAITSSGRTLATLVAPVEQYELAKSKLEALASTAVIGDVVTPVDECWDAST